MSGLDIEAIRVRVDGFNREHADRVLNLAGCAAHELASQVPLLLDEIERLRGELGHSQYVVADGVERIAEHLAEIERLNTESAHLGEQLEDARIDANMALRGAGRDIEQLRRELTEAQREAGRLRRERDDARADVREAGAEIREAEAARDDALQMLADLQGGA